MISRKSFIPTLLFIALLVGPVSIFEISGPLEHIYRLLALKKR